MSANLALTIPDPQERNRRKAGVSFLRVCKGFGECSSPSRPQDATPQPGVPAKSQTLWGKEEQGSERSFRRKAETEMSGLCDDARTTPGRCISALLETDGISGTKYNGIHCDLLGIGGTSRQSSLSLPVIGRLPLTL